METLPPTLCTLEIDEFGIKMEDRSKVYVISMVCMNNSPLHCRPLLIYPFVYLEYSIILSMVSFSNFVFLASKINQALHSLFRVRHPVLSYCLTLFKQ